MVIAFNRISHSKESYWPISYRFKLYISELQIINYRIFYCFCRIINLMCFHWLYRDSLKVIFSVVLISDNSVKVILIPVSFNRFKI